MMDKPSSNKRKRLWRAIIFTVIAIGAVLVMVPPFLLCGGRAGLVAQRNACISNLRRIDVAKADWAYENQKTDGDLIVPSEIDAYVKIGRPSCPSGGSYRYGKLGDIPVCSVAG